jgi:hypothetical protein
VKVRRRWSLWPRLELYMDRLELTEWWGRRRVWQRLPLGRVTHVEAPRSRTLMLRSRNESPGEGENDDALIIEIDEADRWAGMIRAFQACLDDGG